MIRPDATPSPNNASNVGDQTQLDQKTAADRTALAEANAHRRATSAILQVISESRGDVQPVFDAIVANAGTLCEAEFSAVARLEAEQLHLASVSNMSEVETRAYQSIFPRAPHRGYVIGRAFVDGAPVHVEDVTSDPLYDPQTLSVLQQAAPYRTYLGIPILREGRPIGVIGLGRRQVKPFSPQQIELVQTFASQAAIAIENARLFTEIQDKSRQVERQAAELAEWNRTLEARVAEQVNQLARLSKLTRFLSPKISNLIMAGEADDPLQTRRSEITVVYVDLRGFTAFTETTDPEEVISVLRAYHSELGRAIAAFDGTIEHFAGDGAMILFNAPLPTENHELRAVQMCLQLRASMRVLAADWRKRGYDLGFGAGIAGGYATMGTIGFAERLDYSAIGIVCNLASRLCGEAVDGQILISPRIFAKLEPLLDAESVGELSLKGFHRSVKAFNILALKEGAGA